MTEKPKIMVISPMTSHEVEHSTVLSLPGADDVTVTCLSEGPDVIHSRADQALAGMDTLKKAREAEAAGYKAIVLSCHGDPNLFPIREAVKIPVLGSMQTALYFCSLLAGRFTILTTAELYTKRSKEDLITRYGLESKIASIRPVAFKRRLDEVGKMTRQKPIPQEIIEPALTECIKAIQEDDATAITFGCGAFTLMVDDLDAMLKEKGFEIPLVNPLPLAVDVARLLIKQRLSHSQRAFPLAH